jgi:hypothetical protein
MRSSIVRQDIMMRDTRHQRSPIPLTRTHCTDQCANSATQRRATAHTTSRGTRALILRIYTVTMMSFLLMRATTVCLSTYRSHG